MSFRANVVRAVSFAGLLLSCGGVASAAEIEELVVVAQKRAQNVQDVPISITAFSGTEIEERGLNDLQRLAAFVPNFDLPSSNNMRNASVRIRGIGTSGTNPGIETSVGVFVDGLYMPSGAMSLGELSDINTVEVLRGPQGTLYGRNTPVGAVNITTRNPGQSFESLLRLGGGSHDQRWLNGFVGGGLTDDVAGRLAFYYRERDGFESNRAGGRVNDNEEWGVRGRLLFAPTDTLDLNLTGYYAHTERRCCVAEQIDALGPRGIATPGFLAAAAALGYPFTNFDDNDHRVHAVDTGDDEIDSWGVSLQADWELPGGHLLTSLTGYQSWENPVVVANASLPQPVLRSSQEQVNEITSQEFRITSPLGERFEYLGGVYLYAQDTTFHTESMVLEGANRVFPLPPAACAAPCRLRPGDGAFQDFDQETRSVAGFGSLATHLSDVLDVTLGMRWSQDRKDATINHYNAPGVVLPLPIVFPESRIGDRSRRDSAFTWSANTRYRFADDVMGFLSVATGFKSGGFNATRVPTGTPVEFDEETSLSYEAGIKSTWFERRLQLNTTLFWTELKDFQESSMDPRTNAGFIVTNAGEQRSRGIEADFLARPLSELTLSGTFAYLDAEYTDYPNAECAVGETPSGLGNSCNRKGDTPAFSPKWQYSLGVEWAQLLTGFDVEWRVRADYAWVDEQNLIRVSLDEAGDQKAYGLLNLRATLASLSDRWEVSAFVDNVTNEAYFVQAALQPAGGLISGGGIAPAQGYVGWYGPPRTWGLQLSLRASGG